MTFEWRPRRYFGSPRSHELHQLYPPIDLHADTLMWMRSVGYDIGRRHQPLLPRSAWCGHLDLPRLNDINAGAQFFGIATSPIKFSGLYRLANEQIDQLKFACDRYPQRLMLAQDTDDVKRANSSGKVAAFLSLEGAHFLEGDIKKLYRLAERGLRTFGLVHFTPNAAAWPNFGLMTDDRAGLSNFGRRLVYECDRLGILIDLAHANLPAFMQVCAMSHRPVIVSHTGVKGVCPHRRNIDDEQLRAVAETGGVVGIMYEPRYLGGADLAAVMAHLRHAINVAGEEHVALGSDWDGMITPVRGLEHIGKLPNLTEAMVNAGWSEKRIGGILRENILRVLREMPIR
ncbi:MAG: dipeptidase [Patescibacteria group bacterium]